EPFDHPSRFAAGKEAADDEPAVLRLVASVIEGEQSAAAIDGHTPLRILRRQYERVAFRERHGLRGVPGVDRRREAEMYIANRLHRPDGVARNESGLIVGQI